MTTITANDVLFTSSNHHSTSLDFPHIYDVSFFWHGLPINVPYYDSFKTYRFEVGAWETRTDGRTAASLNAPILVAEAAL